MKNFIKDFLSQPLTAFRNLNTTGWVVLAAIGAIFILLTQRPSETPASSLPANKEKSSLDTFIPPGVVLIPIDLENYNSVDSILGPYGVVDLFQSDPARPGKNLLVAKKIKIVRAPQNPSQLAVLVPEEQAALFFKENSVFFAAVQNPKETGTTFEKARPQKPRRTTLVFEESP